MSQQLSCSTRWRLKVCLLMILLYFISPITISIEFCQKKIYKETEEGENSRSFNALFEEDKAKSLREQTRWHTRLLLQCFLEKLIKKVKV